MSEPQKQFGVKVCRERKCIELQKDPEHPDSPEYCQVIKGMPGAMPQCIKEAPPDKFIRRMSSQLNHTFPSPHPGVRNCPKECPYKIEKGTICAFTGEACKEWGVCPCNVLGNEDQENYLKRVLEPTVRVFQKTEPAEILRTCHLHPCPDGMSRCKGGTDCPLIRMPFKDLKVCPLWRIPAKLLAAPVAQIPEKTEKPDTIVVPSPAEMTQKEKTPSRKSSQKEKPTELAEMCRHHKKKGCGIYSGVHDGVDTAKCDGRNPDNWCYVEPVMEKQKRARKEPEETPDERLAAEGDTDKLRKTLEKKDGSKLPEQPVSSLFSLDYMKDIARAMKGAATVSVHAGQDHPIRFDFEIAGIEASFLVAPRIETDGGAE